MLIDTNKTYFTKNYVYIFDQSISLNSICITIFEPIHGKLVCKQNINIEVCNEIVDKCVCVVGVSWRDSNYRDTYREIKALLKQFIDFGEDDD